MCKENLMKIALSIIGIFLICIIPGCAIMSTTSEPLSISNIEGNWEGYHFGYCLLNIESSEKGYMVFMLTGKKYEVYTIESINFSQDRFVISFNIYGEDGEGLTVEGGLIGPNIISLEEADDESEKADDILFLLRESYVPEIRTKAKDVIQRIKEKNT